MDNEVFEKLVRKEVAKYVNERLDKSEGKQIAESGVYIVWSCKAIQNNKAIASTILSDGMYYEVTYNGDKEELYIDAYKRWENVCIKIPEGTVTDIIYELSVSRPPRGTTYGVVEYLEGEATEEALSATKEKVVENVCKAIRDIAKKSDDFFIVKTNEGKTAVGNKFVIPTIEKEAPACRIEIIDERK